MSAFSDKDFNASDYSKFRPTYPKAFFDEILKYHNKIQGNIQGSLVDIGCGPGEAFLPLITEFDRIIATDVSKVMVDTAKSNFESRSTGDSKKCNAQFHVVAAEDLSSVVPDSSIDLVLAAECAHWLDSDAWLTEMQRVLKPNGTLAYFGYVDPLFVGVPEANAIYEELVYEAGDYLGPYWEQPGRSRLRSLLKDVNDKLLQDARYYDTRVVYYDPSTNATPSILNLEKVTTLKDYFNYGKTWSSGHRWRTAHPEATPEQDPFNVFYNRLNKKLGWTMETQIKISLKTVYAFARKAKI